MKKLLAVQAFAAAAAFGQVVDQQQTVSAGAMSARNYEAFYQSITAGLTGTLVRVDMSFYNLITGSGKLEVFAGPRPPKYGSTVGLLASYTVGLVTTSTGLNTVAWPGLSVPIVAGQKYSIRFTPGVGIPDPYAVAVNVFGYAGGWLGISHAYRSNDFVPFEGLFKTWVQ